MNAISDWKLAIHESAHTSAALALGYRVLQVYSTRAGGRVDIEDCPPSSTDEALIHFCGPLAEELLSGIPEPARSEKHSTPKQGLADAGTISHEGAMTYFFETQNGPSDERVIAEFCITGIERDPERWLRRHGFLRHITTRIISDHRAAIIAIATELFRREYLRGNEVTRIFNNPERAKQ